MDFTFNLCSFDLLMVSLGRLSILHQVGSLLQAKLDRQSQSDFCLFVYSPYLHPHRQLLACPCRICFISVVKIDT